MGPRNEVNLNFLLFWDQQFIRRVAMNAMHHDITSYWILTQDTLPDQTKLERFVIYGLMSQWLASFKAFTLRQAMIRLFCSICLPVEYEMGSIDIFKQLQSPNKLASATWRKVIFLEISWIEPEATGWEVISLSIVLCAHDVHEKNFTRVVLTWNAEGKTEQKSYCESKYSQCQIHYKSQGQLWLKKFLPTAGFDTKISR